MNYCGKVPLFILYKICKHAFLKSKNIEDGIFVKDAFEAARRMYLQLFGQKHTKLIPEGVLRSALQIFFQTKLLVWTDEFRVDETHPAKKKRRIVMLKTL